MTGLEKTNYEYEIKKSLSENDVLISVGKVENKNLKGQLHYTLICDNCGSEEIFKKCVPYSYEKIFESDLSTGVFREEYCLGYFCRDCKKEVGLYV